MVGWVTFALKVTVQNAFMVFVLLLRSASASQGLQALHAMFLYLIQIVLTGWPLILTHASVMMAGQARYVMFQSAHLIVETMVIASYLIFASAYLATTQRMLPVIQRSAKNTTLIASFVT